MANVGASYVEVPATEAVVDGMLVTAPAWPAHPAWLARFLEILEGYMTKAKFREMAGATL